jgi:predicted nuclease of predicted toxin-antitoxin system
VNIVLDHNLPPRLARLLSKHFDAVYHVMDFGLECADDREIWEYARDHGLTLMTKDKDFYHLSLLYGPPPKIIWIRSGNMTVQTLIDFVESAIPALKAFANEDEAILHLYRQ